MFREEFEEFASKYTTPTTSDVEVAKSIIIKELKEVPGNSVRYTDTAIFMRPLIRRMAADFNLVPLSPEYLKIEPDFNIIRAEIAIREGIQFFQSVGVLVGIGSLIIGPVIGGDMNGIKHEIRLGTSRNSSIASYAVFYPAIFACYRFATPFAQGENFRLASGDIYLSHLNQTLLPSRAKRCLKECIDAFKHGLYLSAAMSLGAASESLWVRLGRLICEKNPSSSKKLDEQIQKGFPSVGVIIDETWQVLRSQYTGDLDKIFFNRGERDKFKKRADLYCERRNYAMHNEDADEDEPAFTYDETALLLLESVTYFNRLMDIIAAIES